MISDASNLLELPAFSFDDLPSSKKSESLNKLITWIASAVFSVCFLFLIQPFQLWQTHPFAYIAWIALACALPFVVLYWSKGTFEHSERFINSARSQARKIFESIEMKHESPVYSLDGRTATILRIEERLAIQGGIPYGFSYTAYASNEVGECFMTLIRNDSATPFIKHLDQSSARAVLTDQKHPSYKWNFLVPFMLLALITPLWIFIVLQATDSFSHYRRIDVEWVRPVPILFSWLSLPLSIFSLIAMGAGFRKIAFLFAIVAALLFQALSAAAIFDFSNRQFDEPLATQISVMRVSSKVHLGCSKGRCGARIYLRNDQHKLFQLNMHPNMAESIKIDTQIRLELLRGKHDGFYLKDWKLVSK
jgi:hypothetical protein